MFLHGAGGLKVPRYRVAASVVIPLALGILSRAVPLRIQNRMWFGETFRPPLRP